MEDLESRDEGVKESKFSKRDAEIYTASRCISVIGLIWIMGRFGRAVMSEYGLMTATEFSIEAILITLVGAFAGFLLGTLFGVGSVLSTKITYHWSTLARRIILFGSIMILLGSSFIDIILEFEIGTGVILVGVVSVLIPTIHQRIVKGKQVVNAFE